MQKHTNWQWQYLTNNSHNKELAILLPIHTSSAEDVLLLRVDVDGLNLPPMKAPHSGSFALCPCVHQQGLSVGARGQQPGGGGGGVQTHV